MEVRTHFIINRVDIEVSLPVEIIPGYVLKRADATMLGRLKQSLALFDNLGRCKSAYESEYCLTDNRKYQIIDLPQERWRYWIIESKELLDTHLFKHAAALLKDELLLGLTLIAAPRGERIEWHQGVMANVFHPGLLFRKTVPKIGESELKEWRENHALLVGARDISPKACACAERFFNLSELPESSQFKVIGLFSVLESLITHAPELTEPMDSLTHQIKTKMNLLSRRFQRTLDYNSFFLTSDCNKVWGKLYEYRSKIAHGDEADFQGKLKMLRSPEVVTDFLSEATKLLILLALREPQLIADLKLC